MVPSPAQVGHGATLTNCPKKERCARRTSPVPEQELADLGRHVLDQLRVHPQTELTITLVDEAAMTALHERWMDEPGPTDVLSFPDDASDIRIPAGLEAVVRPVPHLGDIVIARGVARRQARAAGHAEATELRVLALHGLLHLLHAEAHRGLPVDRDGSP